MSSTCSAGHGIKQQFDLLPILHYPDGTPRASKRQVEGHSARLLPRMAEPVSGAGTFRTPSGSGPSRRGNPLPHPPVLLSQHLLIQPWRSRAKDGAEEPAPPAPSVGDPKQPTIGLQVKDWGTRGSVLEGNLNTSEARKILGSIWTTVSRALLVISGEPPLRLCRPEKSHLQHLF